jgi:hypothetical protein
MGLSDELHALQELHERGHLSDKEYVDAKAKVLRADLLHQTPTSGAVNTTQFQKKNTSSSLKILGVIVAAIAAVVLIIVSIPDSNTEMDHESSAAESGKEVQHAQTGNVANDRLLALSESDQAFFLGTVVNDGCRGTVPFYMGVQSSTRAAFWSVRCSNGSSYGVEIEADSQGSTRILSCSVLKAVAGVDCFKKF